MYYNSYIFIPHSRNFPSLLIAASNSRSDQQINADYICDGVNDEVEINTALATLSLTGGTVKLTGGTFNIAATINITANQTLSGDGVGVTIIKVPPSVNGIQMGNRQSDGVMRNWMALENLTISVNTGSQTNSAVLIDGGGRGTTIKRVQTQGGKYGFELMDLDRCIMEDLDATNPGTAGIFVEMGKEGTYGKVQFNNCTTSLSNPNSIGMLFDKSASGSSNSIGDIVIIGHLFFSTTGVSGTVGIQANVGIKNSVLIGSQFESPIYHVILTGSSVVNLSFIDCSILQNAAPGTLSTDFVQFNGGNHVVTVRDCTFQQVTNLFHSISGSPIVILEGASNNQGNITNVWTGGFGHRMGTDTVFGGDANMVCGLNNQRYDAIFANKWRGNASAPMQIVPSADGTNVIQVRKTDGSTIIFQIDTTNSRLVFAEGSNIQAGTTTGSKIGVAGGASGEKWGFYGATPIVQPLLATGASHTVDDVITVLQNLGLVRQS